MKKLGFIVIVMLLSVSTIIIAQKPTKTGSGGDHPFMNAAKKKLTEAVTQLKKATHDYQGHRVKAIQLVEDAIKEIDLGLASDKDNK
jgi:hypothetical protein